MGAAVSAATGVLGLINGMNGQRSEQKAADRNSRSQAALTAEQVAMIRQMQPLIASLQGGAGSMVDPLQKDAAAAFQDARRYDPHADTEAGMRAYDASAQESLNRDMAGARMPMSMRGFNAGNGSSDLAAAEKDVLGRRAFDRGQLSSALTMGERERKAAVTANAADRGARVFQMFDPTGRVQGLAGSLAGPAASYGNSAAQHSYNAAQWDPSGSVSSIAAGLKGMKFPWMKPKPSRGPMAMDPTMMGMPGDSYRQGGGFQYGG